MKKSILLILITILLSLFFQEMKDNQKSQFLKWKEKHGISYHSQVEDAFRQKIFKQKLELINKHNSDPSRTYNMGLNQFSALTKAQFKQTYLTLDVPQKRNKLLVNNDKYVGQIDWVDQGGVTPVKNQGQCGSCWAFSATGGLQGLSLLSTGDLRTFSEQQLVDCSGPQGNHGCSGGLMTNAFNYVIQKGIMVQDDYPYTSRSEKCKKDGGKFKITSYVEIANGDCNSLANSLLSRPVSVAVEADHWDTYQSGIFSNCKDDLDHGVTLVGMTQKYWKIKNSWGFSWGEKGFIRLARGNTCGICEMSSYPTR